MVDRDCTTSKFCQILPVFLSVLELGRVTILRFPPDHGHTMSLPKQEFLDQIFLFYYITHFLYFIFYLFLVFLHY